MPSESLSNLTVLTRWTEKLTLRYMQRSPRPPLFVYGFAFRFTESPKVTMAKLQALQDNIPTEAFRDRKKYDPVSGICAYIVDEIGGDYDRRFFGRTNVDSNRDILFVLRFYASVMADTPARPQWVDDVAGITSEILVELGWEDVPKPMWYLEESTLAAESYTDYNWIPHRVK
ncbi:hypothetical protein MKEN_01401800 [Mycena kentingensis (nom. inval.)]|nr:hypothetical protein MKEN_01401800 [Mycena kentingensis (nom. inval.)]